MYIGIRMNDHTYVTSSTSTTQRQTNNDTIEYPPVCGEEKKGLMHRKRRAVRQDKSAIDVHLTMLGQPNHTSVNTFITRGRGQKPVIRDP